MAASWLKYNSTKPEEWRWSSLPLEKGMKDSRTR